MDGDMVDPTVDDTADRRARNERGGVGGRPAEVDDPLVDDDAPERASEIDDITEALERIVAESSEDHGHGHAMPEDAPDDTGVVDYSDVDVPALLAEREDFRALAQRIQADFDNYRKRSAAQAQADAERATGQLATALLPVLDAAEAAFVEHPDEIGPLLSQMLTELKRHGLEALDLDGQPFDPEVAEAVAHEEGEGGAPVVAEVLRSGYRWKGRTLRPAMVKTTD